MNIKYRSFGFGTPVPTHMWQMQSKYLLVYDLYPKFLGLLKKNEQNKITDNKGAAKS